MYTLLINVLLKHIEYWRLVDDSKYFNLLNLNNFFLLNFDFYSFKNVYVLKEKIVLRKWYNIHTCKQNKSLKSNCVAWQTHF